MNQKSVTLTLKLMEEKTKKIYGVIEKSVGLSSDEQVEENVRPFSTFIKSLANEINDVCEKQGLQLSDAESFEQQLLINILLSLTKEEMKDIAIDILVVEKIKPEEIKEDGK